MCRSKFFLLAFDLACVSDAAMVNYRFCTLPMLLLSCEAAFVGPPPLSGRSDLRRRVTPRMGTTKDFKVGLTIEFENSVWKVQEFLHVKPGKGSAFVRSKLKNLQTGSTLESARLAWASGGGVHTGARELSKPRLYGAARVGAADGGCGCGDTLHFVLGGAREVYRYISWGGGFSEANKVSSMAEIWHLPIAFHDCTGPVAFALSPPSQYRTNPRLSAWLARWLPS